MVFSPHAPMHRLLRWPYTRVTGAVLQQAVRISPMSNAEGDLIRRRFTHLAERVHVVPTGVDGAAIRAARGLSEVPDHTVLTVARLERHKRVDRTVAAMAAVPPAYRLAVVGAGPALRWLASRAADLRVASRVQFVGAVADDLLYRWLRTAHVLVSVAEQDASGVPVMEALSAGAPVVATDIPVHREAAAFVPGAPIVFVPSEPSPLRIADAVLEASGMSTASSAALALPCWDTVVDSTCALYEELLGNGARRNGSSRNGSSPNGSSSNGSSSNGSSPNGKEHMHVNGNGRGRSLQVEA
jgi:glycosyltransferase involved in cell wall biosynthesis